MTTVSDVKQFIIDEVGDTTPATLAPLIDSIWDSYADKQVIFPRMQEFYAKKRSIEIVRATLRNQVDFAHDGALNLRLSQRIDYLNAQYEWVCGEIVRFEAIARANRTPVIGLLVGRQLAVPPFSVAPGPAVPPAVQPDALDPFFVGSPYVDNRGVSPTP